MADSVERFAELARKFCSWVVTGSDRGPQAARQALCQVGSLYVAALALPPRMREEYLIAEPNGCSDWSNLYQGLVSRLPFQHYGGLENQGFEPIENPNVGDIADDLTDIHVELNNGLKCYEAGYHADAIWMWRNGLVLHWGEHATAAMRALHTWLASKHPELLVEGGAEPGAAADRGNGDDLPGG